MTKLKLASSVLAVAATFTSPAYSAGPTDGINVNVTNTPLPVTVTNPTTSVTLTNSSVTVSNPASNPVLVRDADASGRTHFGQRVENHVVLTWVSPGNQNTICTPNKEFRRLFPDGTFATEAFVVPQDRVLVVTDVDVTLTAGLGNTFELGRAVYAVVAADTQKNSVLTPHKTAGVLITNQNSGAIALSSSLGAGAPIGSGRQVCVRAEALSNLGGYLDYPVHDATIRGYLISAQ